MHRNVVFRVWGIIYTQDDKAALIYMIFWQVEIFRNFYKNRILKLSVNQSICLELLLRTHFCKISRFKNGFLLLRLSNYDYI